MSREIRVTRDERDPANPLIWRQLFEVPLSDPPTPLLLRHEPPPGQGKIRFASGASPLLQVEDVSEIDQRKDQITKSDKRTRGIFEAYCAPGKW